MERGPEWWALVKKWGEGRGLSLSLYCTHEGAPGQPRPSWWPPVAAPVTEPSANRVDVVTQRKAEIQKEVERILAEREAERIVSQREAEREAEIERIVAQREQQRQQAERDAKAKDEQDRLRAESEARSVPCRSPITGTSRTWTPAPPAPQWDGMTTMDGTPDMRSRNNRVAAGLAPPSMGRCIIKRRRCEGCLRTVPVQVPLCSSYYDFHCPVCQYTVTTNCF